MPTLPSQYHIRPATPSDIPELSTLISLSIRALSTLFYTPSQISGSLGFLFGPDEQLIADGTYFVLTHFPTSETILACGGWSFRKTLFGSSSYTPGRAPARRNPAVDAASIRAIFVHPNFARQGLGTRILEHCENAAIDAGFRELEMGSTLTGLSLYTKCGYEGTGEELVHLPNGDELVVVCMKKKVDR